MGKNNEFFTEKYDFLSNLIGIKIKDFESKQINQMIDSSDNFKNLFQKIKKITKTQIIRSFVNENKETITDIKAILENFKKVFESKFKGNDRNFDENILIIDSNEEKLENFEISMNDIIFALKDFDIKKAQGFTFIDNKVIKFCLNGVSKMFYCLFNKILDFEKLPNGLKTAIVSPVLKANKPKNQFLSYRCISVQPNIYKVFENIVLHKLKPFLEMKQVIPKSQYGYRDKIGISNIHIDIKTKIYETLNDKNYLGIDMIFLDLSDAFDTISHNRLIHKLEKYGINGKFLNIIKASFESRKQIIKYEDSFSENINVISGVLQGGVTSPTFFNVYLADLTQYIKCDVFSFADDIVLMKPIYNLNDCLDLQNDLTLISEFFDNNFLRLNPLKCEYMRIGLKNNETFDYKITDISVKKVDIHKQVGVTYDSKMSFDHHLNEITAKAIKKFGLLKFICKRVDTKTFLRLYLTYILPILEYSNLCLTYNKTQSKRLESVQKRITKYICVKEGNLELKYEQRLNHLKIESLEKRRNKQILKLLQKIKIGFKDISEKWINEIEFYENSRHGTFAKIRFNRLTKTDKNIFDFSIKLFNNLPKHIRNEPNLSNFMNQLNAFL